jgi:hypothetical protein
MKAVGESLQSPAERERLDSASARTFAVPGTKMAVRKIFLSSQKLAMRRETSQRSFDWHPPSLLM